MALIFRWILVIQCVLIRHQLLQLQTLKQMHAHETMSRRPPPAIATVLASQPQNTRQTKLPKRENSNDEVNTRMVRSQALTLVYRL